MDHLKASEQGAGEARRQSIGRRVRRGPVPLFVLQQASKTVKHLGRPEAPVTQPARPAAKAGGAPGRPAVPSTSSAASTGGGLRRELNLFGAVSMIVGIVIGSGIFLGVNRVAA